MITVDEWRAELERVQADCESPDGLSMGELQARLGCGEKIARKVLRHAKANGRLVTAHRKETGVDGRVQWIPVYRIVDGRVR